MYTCTYKLHKNIANNYSRYSAWTKKKLSPLRWVVLATWIRTKEEIQMKKEILGYDQFSHLSHYISSRSYHREMWFFWRCLKMGTETHHKHDIRMRCIDIKEITDHTLVSTFFNCLPSFILIQVARTTHRNGGNIFFVYAKYIE